MLSVLVVDDEPALASLWEAELGAMGARVALSPTLIDARVKLSRDAFDLLLLDVNLPDGCGLDLLQEMSAARRGEDVVVTTAHADVPTAVRALRLGASDFLTKPCRFVELERHALRVSRERESRVAEPATPHAAAFRWGVLVGESEAIGNVRRLIGRVAPVRTAVLIQGETGTGKELAARMIHAQSRNADRPFVVINCGALPTQLGEGELFGHRTVSFAGSAAGTLFLDEVGDLPLELQGRLLRQLELGDARPANDGAGPAHCPARVVASTHRDLRRHVADGGFREDLYYRLAAFELGMPALRSIPRDVPVVAQHLLDALVVPGSMALTFSAEALDVMCRYDWPGNVRELRNVIERAKILTDGPEIPASALPIPSAMATTQSTQAFPSEKDTDVMNLADMEWVLVRRALAAHKGNKTAAARALGISVRTLYNKLEAHAHETGQAA